MAELSLRHPRCGGKEGLLCPSQDNKWRCQYAPPGHDGVKKTTSVASRSRMGFTSTEEAPAVPPIVLGQGKGSCAACRVSIIPSEVERDNTGTHWWASPWAEGTRWTIDAHRGCRGQPHARD